MIKEKNNIADIVLKDILGEINRLVKGKISPKTVRLVIKNVISEIDYTANINHTTASFLLEKGGTPNYGDIFKEIIWQIKRLLEDINIYKDYFSYKSRKNRCVLTYEEMKYVVELLQDMANNICTIASIIANPEMDSQSRTNKRMAYLVEKLTLTEKKSLVDNHFTVIKNLIALMQTMHYLTALLEDLFIRRTEFEAQNMMDFDKQWRDIHTESQENKQSEPESTEFPILQLIEEDGRSFLGLDE